MDALHVNVAKLPVTPSRTITASTQKHLLSGQEWGFRTNVTQGQGHHGMTGRYNQGKPASSHVQSKHQAH